VPRWAEILILSMLFGASLLSTVVAVGTLINPPKREVLVVSLRSYPDGTYVLQRTFYVSSDKVVFFVRNESTIYALYYGPDQSLVAFKGKYVRSGLVTLGLLWGGRYCNVYGAEGLDYSVDQQGGFCTMTTLAFLKDKGGYSEFSVSRFDSDSFALGVAFLASLISLFFVVLFGALLAADVRDAVRERLGRHSQVSESSSEGATG